MSARLSFVRSEKCAASHCCFARRFGRVDNRATRTMEMASVNRDRFHTIVDFGVSVRIVIHEYLACYVHWD